MRPHKPPLPWHGVNWPGIMQILCRQSWGVQENGSLITCRRHIPYLHLHFQPSVPAIPILSTKKSSEGPTWGVSWTCQVEGTLVGRALVPCSQANVRLLKSRVVCVTTSPESLPLGRPCIREQKHQTDCHLPRLGGLHSYQSDLQHKI